MKPNEEQFNDFKVAEETPEMENRFPAKSYYGNIQLLCQS